MARLSWSITLAAVSALFIWSAASFTASLLAHRADWLAERPARGSGSLHDPVDARYLTSMELARRLDPLNADHIQRIADEREDRAMRGPVYARGRSNLLRESLALNRTAATLRPTWPMSLTPVLRLKLKLSELDREFSDLFRRAAELGRWEPASVRTLAEIALAAWPMLDDGTRADALGVLERGLRTQPGFIVERAARTGNIRLIEPLVAGDPSLESLYRRYAGREPNRPLRPGP